MSYKSYAFSSSMIQYRQLSLLNKEDILNAASSSNVAENALATLKEKGYAKNAGELENIFDFEDVVAAELLDAIEFLKSVCPDRKLLDLFLLKYDYLNAKTLLKLNLLGKEFSSKDMSKNGTISFEVLKESIADNNYSRLHNVMAQAMRSMDKSFAINEDATTIGLIMDKAYSVHVKELLADINNDVIKKYFEAYADFTNILMVLRLRNTAYSSDILEDTLLVGGKLFESELKKAFEDKSDSAFSFFLKYGYEKVLKEPFEKLQNGEGLFFVEKSRDDYLMDILKTDRYDMFSSSMVVSYLIAKEREAAAVRLLMVGMLNNIGVNDIEKRLKDLY